MALTKQQKRRAQRAKDFANQNIKKASDFNFDQHNRKGVEGTHVSGQETKHLRKTAGREEAYAALQAQKDAGATFGKRAQKQFDRMGARIEAKEKAKAAKGSTGQATNPIDDTQTGQGDNVNNNGNIASGNNNAVVENNIDNSMEQNIDQDNDQTSNVNGNNNTVIQEADNSIRMYGGDNRTFTYNSTGGGNGSTTDTPVSAATMAGFYDVNDSPAAQAGFVDMYSTMNADNQKRYAGDAMKTFAKYGNLDARDYTNESMETALGRSIQDSYDRSDVQTGHVFGDIWNDNYITEDWQMPDSPAEIKSNAEEIADDAKEDVEDM